jgi:predicted RNA methylase
VTASGFFISPHHTDEVAAFTRPGGYAAAMSRRREQALDGEALLPLSRARRIRLVAAAIRAGQPSADAAFDRALPPALREVSPHYWTPARVGRVAARWLREIDAQHVVDIGSGAGKFCVVAALLTRCRLTGIEHRASLVDAARDLAKAYEVSGRVTFVHGGLDAAASIVADTYYLFNPFGHYSFDSDQFVDPGVRFTTESQQRDVAATAALLERASAGTFVLTYNGFGGSVPSSYEQLDAASGLPGTLRLWKKTRSR